MTGHEYDKIVALDYEGFAITIDGEEYVWSYRLGHYIPAYEIDCIKDCEDYEDE